MSSTVSLLPLQSTCPLTCVLAPEQGTGGLSRTQLSPVTAPPSRLPLHVCQAATWPVIFPDHSGSQPEEPSLSLPAPFALGVESVSQHMAGNPADEALVSSLTSLGLQHLDARSPLPQVKRGICLLRGLIVSVWRALV